jgi:hypothetical protein
MSNTPKRPDLYIGVAVVALALAACARSPSVPRPARQPVCDSRRALTERDMARFADMSLEAALMRARPEILRYHGQKPTLFVDGRVGSWDELRELRADRVWTVRLLSPVEAAMEFGAFQVEPILDVRTVASKPGDCAVRCR